MLPRESKDLLTALLGRSRPCWVAAILKRSVSLECIIGATRMRTGTVYRIFGLGFDVGQFSNVERRALALIP